MHRSIVASSVGRVFNRLITIATVGALVVDLDDNGLANRFAVALVPIGLRLEVPAGATGSTHSVDDWGVAGAVDSTVGVLEGERVEGCCTDALDAGSGWSTGYCWTAVVVPGEGCFVDG